MHHYSQLEAPNIQYFEKYNEEGGGALIIKGLSFPKTKTFDILAEIWANVRRRICERYAVDSTGIFMYSDEEEIISCSFLLNYGFAKSNDIDSRVYVDRFCSTFQEQMAYFEEVIDAFILDEENGYLAYCDFIQNTNSVDSFKNFILKFLRLVNVRTAKDDRRSRRRKEIKARLNK